MLSAALLLSAPPTIANDDLAVVTAVIDSWVHLDKDWNPKFQFAMQEVYTYEKTRVPFSKLIAEMDESARIVKDDPAWHDNGISDIIHGFVSAGRQPVTYHPGPPVAPSKMGFDSRFIFRGPGDPPFEEWRPIDRTGRPIPYFRRIFFPPVSYSPGGNHAIVQIHNNYGNISGTVMNLLTRSGGTWKAVAQQYHVQMGVRFYAPLSPAERVSGVSLLYLLNHHGHGKQAIDRKQRIVATINGKAPSSEFMEAFESHAPPLSYVPFDITPEGVFRRGTREIVTLYNFEPSISRSGNKATVKYLYRSVGWGFGSSELYLERKNDKWRVIGEGEIMKG